MRSANPFARFKRWFRDAEAAGELLPEAMALATATRDGRPSVRMVLHRGFSRDGFVFYTNYSSRKSVELFENPRASAVFHWPKLERQVRIEGRVEKLTRAESMRYFRTRPMESRISAWASPQGAIVADRRALETAFTNYRDKFAEDDDVPCPPFWGGFRIVSNCIEFWQGRPYRLHDREVYRLKQKAWIVHRLGP